MPYDHPSKFFDYGYPLTPKWPEKESPCSGWSESSELYSFGLLLWLLDDSFNQHISIYDGIQHTSASGLACFRPHPTHGPGETCKHQRNNCLLLLLQHLWAGHPTMYIFFGVCTVVMRPHSKTLIRKDLTISMLQFHVHWIMYNNYPSITTLFAEIPPFW